MTFGAASSPQNVCAYATTTRSLSLEVEAGVVNCKSIRFWMSAFFMGFNNSEVLYFLHWSLFVLSWETRICPQYKLAWHFLSKKGSLCGPGKKRKLLSFTFWGWSEKAAPRYWPFFCIGILFLEKWCNSRSNSDFSQFWLLFSRYENEFVETSL